MAQLPNLIFVNFPSFVTADVAWPNTNVLPLYAANDDIGVPFTTSNTVQDVLTVASSTNFFGFDTQSNSSGLNLMFRSTYNYTTRKYGFELLPSNTLLGNVAEGEIFNQFWLTQNDNGGFVRNLDNFSQFLLGIMNGPTTDTNIYNCPCVNDVSDKDWCGLSAWNFLTQLVQVELPGKTKTWIGPCMDPGKSMVIEGGLGNFVKATVQVKRVRNMNRLKFRSVNAQVKPCSKSILFKINAESCPELARDEFAGVDTKLGIDFSVQATVLGQNVFDTGKRFCDQIPPVEQFQNCGNYAAQCLEVFLPSALVSVELEVPVVDYPGPTSMSTVSKNDAIAQCQFFNFNNSFSAYTTLFANSTLSLDFALLDKPEINFPGGINTDLKFVIETAIMQAANTSLRSIISKQVGEQIAPFLVEALAVGQVVDGIPLCLNFSQTFDSMSCMAGMVPNPPTQCNPCDFCCLCLTGGDCGEKCLQECPCVIPFCSQVDRIFDPLYWIIFCVIVGLILIFTIVGAGFLKGLM